jgi:hypothetical protein
MNAIAPNSSQVTFLDSTREQRREVLYRCAESLLRGLLNGAGEGEKEALFQSLEHLGIAEIRNLNANAKSFTGSGTGTVQSVNIKDFQNHDTTHRLLHQLQPSDPEATGSPQIARILRFPTSEHEL